MTIGLLLGAGASFELGMPLAKHLTREITRWLTPEKLRSLNDGWRDQGGGLPDQVVNDLLGELARPGSLYEEVLGHLETQFRRMQGADRQTYHHLYSWLVELVYHLLYYRHVRNGSYIQAGLPFFEGLRGLAGQSKPLWVFSLNHDLLMEILAAEFGVPVRTGFGPDQLSFPRRCANGDVIGSLDFESLRTETLDHSGLGFASQGVVAINLLKLHGSLDVFSFDDGKWLLKLCPTSMTTSGILQTLEWANTQLIYDPGVKPTNEIAFADDTGEMKFLRRTILAGAYKFDSTSSQVLPTKLLDHFRGLVNNVTKVYSIGYSFGDPHVNEIIRSWLEFSSSRRLTIVDPFRVDRPPGLRHLSSQIDLIGKTASAFFSLYASEPLSPRLRVAQVVRSATRTYQSWKTGV